MKAGRCRKIALLICLLVLFSVPTGAAANSGPAHWENPPSLSLTPLTDCPVAVERENLSFDFTAAVEKDHTAGSRSYYSPVAMVTAAYQMKNTSPQAVTVSMAFPLIASLSVLAGLHGISIEANGQKIPYRVKIGDTMPEEGYTRSYYGANGTLIKTSLPSFDEILKDVNKKPATLKYLNGAGKRYDSVGGELKSSVNARCVIQPGKAFFVTTGFNGFSIKGGSVQLEASSGQNGPVSFFAVGSGVESIDVLPPMNSSKCPADSFFDELVKKSAVYQAYPSPEFQEDLRAAAEEYADARMSKGQIVVDDGQMAGFYEQNRILVLTYDVKFPANGAVPVSVSYPMGGAMEADSTKKQVYTYGYLLNPAKGWKEFRNLNLRITPPKANPNVLKSSIPLNLSGKAYTAALSALPEEDLVFSLNADSPAQTANGSVSPAPGKTETSVLPDGKEIGGLLLVMAAILLLASLARHRRNST